MKGSAVQRKWYLVSEEKMIPLNQGCRVTYGEHDLAIFRTSQSFHAIENKCPHRGGPLADGIVAGEAVYCPLHNLKIGFENGCAQNGGEGKVKVYPVKVIDGKVYVAFDEGKNCDG